MRQFVIDGRRLNATRGLVEAAAHERAFLARVLGGARMVVIRSKQDLANIEMNGEGVRMLGLKKRATKVEDAPHQRVRLLRDAIYAREPYAPGALLVVDRDTAQKWLGEGVAELASEPAPLWPICRACGTQFAVAAAVEPGRWIACPNPRCQGGWVK